MATESPVDIGDTDTTCSLCYAEFLDPEDLKLHITQVHLNEINLQRYCQFCSLIFSSLEDYVLHIRDQHLTSIKCCKYCTRAFTDFNLLRKHESKHYTFVQKSMYSCSQCKDTFSSVLELERHEYKTHSSDDEGIMLHDCFPLLSSMLNIKASSFLHSLGTNTEYKCIRCEFMSTEVEYFIKHLKEKNCRSFACDKCSNVYKEIKGLKRHLSAHVECQNYVASEDSKKQCPKCLKEVDAVSHSDHLKHCHPISCSVCKIPFETLNELQEHQTESHPLAITLTRCQFCHREFVGKLQLDKHIDRIHKGQFHLYKYACVYCESTYFKHPKDLLGHFFSKHHDVEPYSCKICNKTFRVRKRFTIHIKLEHKSVGFVEFDEQFHVFFTDKKSEHPFQPKSFFTDSNNDRSDEEGMSQTDIETESKDDSKTKKKSRRVTFEEKEQTNKGEGFENIYSDLMSVSETDGNKTDNGKSVQKTQRKRKSKTVNPIPKKKSKTDVTTEAETELSESDDEPLLVVRKREKIRRICKLRFAAGNKIKRRSIKDNKKRFTCNICKKYCYTFQNYHHHVSMHFKNEVKKCIKCSKEFKSKTELNKHVENEHATSRLTETLKNLLERRKKGITLPQLTSTQRFQKTIKRVPAGRTDAQATLTEVSDKLSVQKFIENFTPDTTSDNTPKKSIDVEAVVSVKSCNFVTRKPPVIKMTKFVPKPENKSTKLAMPVKFKQNITEKAKVNVKIIQNPEEVNQDYEDNNSNDDNQDSFVDYDNMIENEKDDVPEMAQEVMLEETVEPKPPVIPHKIFIPKLPKEFNKNKIRIAHLQTEAPFYKIVTINDVINPKGNAQKPKPPENIKLPDGTKLVNVNPLAHLLGDIPVEKIVGPGTSNKYYKPKMDNFEHAIAKALLKLETPTAFSKKKTKKKSVEVEQ